MNKPQLFLTLLFLLLVTFISGIFIGRSYKKNTIQTITKIDTIINYVTIKDSIIIHTKPTNTILYKTINKVNNVTKIDTSIGFTSTDTLRFDSLFVAITDTGNCNGIINRQSVFGGKIITKEISKTITKEIEKPTPLFQINAGVQSSFIGKWENVDLGPAIQVQLKQKYSVGYSYLIGSSTHNISLLTKIK